MRYFFIMNPGSGGGKSRERCRRILAVLQEKKIDYDYQLTKTLEEAYKLSLEANKKGYEAIVAVGGDGTINRVINGFYDSRGRRISGARLGVIHTGTSPDFCRSYNIPREIDHALHMVLEGKSREISIGKITCSRYYDRALNGQSLDLLKDNNQLQTGYFACCANIGLGAVLARKANSGVRKYLGDFTGTFAALLQILVKYRPADLIVYLDGVRQELLNVYNISIGKTTYIASGIKVKNNLAGKDSRFYSLIIKDIGWADWPGVISTIYGGQKFVNNNVMSLSYGQVIEVYGSSRNNEVEFDGDPGGFLPCVIENAQDAIDLICEVSEI